MPALSQDAVVIGGGFFGCEVALELRRLGFERILLVEREQGLLQRASYVNQARVHNGYHYPRSYATAIRSRRNFFHFAEEYREAVVDSFVKLYAIARGSRVSASQFSTFCAAIGAPCRPAPQRYRHLFDLGLIEDCFLTQEFAFDSARLAAKLHRELIAASIEIRTGAAAQLVASTSSSVTVDVGGQTETASWLFNCTYGALERTGIRLKSRIKKELAEMLLIEPPLPVANVGITVMDGPYFSTMPFPAAKLHSFSHVRYTPHHDRPGIALQIDMGTIFLEGEDPLVLHDAAPLAAHAHVSEPNLQPLGSEGLDHRPLASALKASGYAGFLSIEMRAGDNWEAALASAARLLQEEYL